MPFRNIMGFFQPLGTLIQTCSIGVRVAVKTITLSEDAHNALVAIKEEGESFSEALRRLTRGRRSLLDFAGDWKDFAEDQMSSYRSFLKAGDRLSKAKLRHEFGRRQK